MSVSASRLESMYPRGTRGRKISSAEIYTKRRGSAEEDDDDDKGDGV